VNRREFLKYGGRATLAVAALGIPGCSAAVTSLTPSASTHTAPGPPTDADWAALASRITGTVVRSHDPTYAVDTQLFNPRFDGSTPAGIVYCASVSDVQRTVAFAQAHAMPITARSGGHSYAGYSTGMGVVCDVTRMAGVAAQPEGSAVIGAGARLIDVYAALAPQGVAVAAGSCPTVGIAGLALGGGLGVTGRKFGLTCDNVTQLTVVTASGDTLTCDESRNSDLYWACRGGGGGSFGIVTSLTAATHTVPALTLFTIRWPWRAAAEVIAAWQDWIATIPDELWSICHVLSTTTPGSPSISVDGAYLGTQPALTPWLNALQKAVGTAAGSVSVGAHAFLDAMLIEAGCAGQSVASCHLAQPNTQGTLQREASLGRSDIALQPLNAAAISVIVDGVEQRQANPDATTIAGVAMESLGGAINRVAPDATAFVHRNGLFSTQYNATWPTGATSAVVQSNIDGVNALYAAMRPFASGSAYQNYIDPALTDWPHAYFGSNLSRLMTVKARYDPLDLFHFAQSIPIRGIGAPTPASPGS
jgi:FAD/FMN-containing dehydrogenase